MKKQSGKQKLQRVRQQSQRQLKKASKNSARYRSRHDGAYKEAHLDDIIRHQIRVGQPPEWIAVLNGAAPGIVLPRGEADIGELEASRQAVLEMHGVAAPETAYDPELDQYLSPQQLKSLDRGLPVIMMAYVERQFDVSRQRSNSLLQNRVRDAIEFGIGQSIQYAGRLSLPPETAKTCTAGRASTEALLLFAGSWAPKIAGKEADWWSDYVEHLKSAGSLHERADHFVDPEIRHELIKAEIISAFGGSPSAQAERRFWHTTIRGLLRCKNHDGPQASAHRSISRSHQKNMAVDRANILEFMGVTRSPLDLIDLMALAYFEMPDAHRLFPTFHFHFPDFEALSALGALSRGRSVRIDAKTARRLAQNLRDPKPVGRANSEETLPEPFTPQQFIRHAMARVGSDEWWSHVLASPADNFGVRHFRKGEDLGPVGTGADTLALDTPAAQQASAKLLAVLVSSFDLRLDPVDGSRTWQYLVPGNLMFLDLDRMSDVSRGDFGLMMLQLVDALAAGLHRGLGLDEFQTFSPQLPGYYREMVRVAAASQLVMQVVAPQLCGRRELDLRYYARFLTDREYQTAHMLGETTGRRILEIIGYPHSS